MREKRKLNINGAVLDRNQLTAYLAKLASSHILTEKSEKDTYPIPNLLDNYEFIKQTYKLLNEHVKLGIPIHPAGEWILDNFYIIEENVKTISKELTRKKYINFLGLGSGIYKGFARDYVLASEIVAYTDAKIEYENLEYMLEAYQTKKKLNMDEIWNIGLFIQIALIQNIRQICETIYLSQMQKYKVEIILAKFFKDEETNIDVKQILPKKKSIIKTAQMKNTFIEYMSYKLKKYGRKAYSYLNILEEEVKRAGGDISDIIQKEHFDIAVNKVSIGNSIISLKEISRINFAEIFEKINGVEEILKMDPARIYEKMDNDTKIYYRNSIKEIAQKTKISEIYIARKCLDLCLEEQKKEESNNTHNITKQMHIGYYLISDGREKMLSILLNKNVRIMSNNLKEKLYIGGIWGITFLGALATSVLTYLNIGRFKILISTVLFFLLLIPIENIVSKIIQNILLKIVKPKPIPKLDFQNGIPEEYATMVVIPTIVASKEKVEELMKKLEVYYISNKSKNIYFTLLGDCSGSSKEKEEYDEDVIKAGINGVKELNEKYKEDIFNFIYRKRIWNPNESMYMGWERKRGLLNQFNEYLLGKIKDPFRINTIENSSKKPNIKYIITLDSDTDLILNSGIELIGAMAHILNKPELNENGDLVISGHAIMQPRVGIGLLESRKSIFTQIYAGEAGTDSYASAVSDIYQDNFDEGIFTGKGIYDLNIFSTVLNNEIKENTVLSHDLLEGSYLRCADVSDIMVMDEYPSNYLSFKTRLYRWIRGDWQVTLWLKSKIEDRTHHIKENPLNLLSKYKIFNNIIRSKLELSVLLVLILSVVTNLTLNINLVMGPTITILSIIIPVIIDFINKIINAKTGRIRTNVYTKTIDETKAGIYKSLLDLSLIPDKAYISLKAEIKTLYRMYKSKMHLLEWITSEEAEKTAKTDILSYYKSMFSNVIFGMFGILAFTVIKSIGLKILCLIFGTMWLISPFIMYKISRNIKTRRPIEDVNKEDKDYIKQIAYKTWLYFKDNLTEENNYLPPDNYQEDRKQKIVLNTSSTNIGLALLAVMTANDLNFENLNYSIDLIYKMLETIIKMQKWNGHLYNWYNIRTLEPLVPRYISSVDSGNFVGYLYVTKQFLIEKKQCLEKNIYNNENISEITKSSITENVNKIKLMVEQIDNLIENTDFSKLYNSKNRLFSVGYNIEEGKLTDSYYDLLASEARQTSLVAIAKKDISEKHWCNLSRTLTTLNNYKGLISWSGTAFEYLMPTINIPEYPASILDESCKFMIMSQIEYAKKLGIPWGFSEAAFNLKDLNNNYQYKAFGIPWLGLKRGLSEEIVVSSYGTILAINEVPNEVIENIKDLQNKGMYEKYGFYESIDFTPGRNGKNYSIVKTYMAHHQALILLSIDNLINNNIFQTRFMQNPEMKAVSVLLQERMPKNMIITKEEKEKVEKIKYMDYEDYTQRKYTKINDYLNVSNVIANDKYTIVMDQYGNGYSKFGNIQINRYKPTDEIDEGISFYIKNIKNKKIWTNGVTRYLPRPDRYSFVFAPEMNKFKRIDENIETSTRIIVDTDEPVEIRTLELKNTGNNTEILEITSYLEPILSDKMQDYSHKAFNNLFLNFEYIDEINTVLVKRKAHVDGEKESYMAVTMYADENEVGEMEYEIDKEKFFGRDNFGIPRDVQNSIPLSKKISYTTDPIVAIRRTIEIKSNETANLNLIISVSDSKDKALKNLVKFMNSENVKRTVTLLRAKNEAENRYLGIKGKDIEVYQKMLSYLLFPTKVDVKKPPLGKVSLITNELWKFGISGELPILLVKIKEINDIDIIRAVLNAYEFFRVKNINIDLVILNEEKESYENYVKDVISSCILNKNLSYMLNVPGGIFCLNNIDEQDKKMLEARASLIINSTYSSLEIQMEDFEEKLLENVKEVAIDYNNKIVVEDEEHKSQEKDMTELKYYNEYGGFSQDGKEYIIKVNKENKLPTVWSNILVNKKFGTITTEGMGGYTWKENCRIKRITAWSNNQIMDIPSEIVYLKDLTTNKKWSIAVNPMPDDNDYYVIYGFGYSKYIHNSSKINQTLEMYVPQEDNAKINLITLDNKNPERKKLRLVYYIKPALDEDETKSNQNIKLDYNEESNMIIAKNLINENKSLIFISSSEKIESYTGSKTSFLKGSSLSNPIGLDQLELSREDAYGQDGIIAISMNVIVEAYSSKQISITLGAGDSLEDIQDISYKYSNISNCKSEYLKIKRYWSDLIDTIQVFTPMESTNIILNGWLIYQLISARLYARTGFYQSGGAFGFRDQLQDTLAAKYVDSNIERNQILKHAENQFVEGDVLHWWHEDLSRGIRTKMSDDLLWLPYTTYDYIEFTNDYKILDEIIPYKEGRELSENEDERYDVYKNSVQKGSLYEHCIKAIERSLNFGEHDLPKIGTGDWNDGMNKVGEKGRGESVWLGFFMYDVLNKFIKICEYKNDTEKIEKYTKIINKLKKALNTEGWDSRWYRRAFTDNGEILGSLQNEECKIDGISQSWAVISGAGDNDKKYIAMDSLENHLIDKEIGIIKLLDPPFEKGKINPGYIKSYLPGTRENGGQYTHGAIWTIIAQAILNLNDKAYENFRMINPIEHSRTKVEANKYKVEPYVVAADIYGKSDLAGRGGWTWYTGSAAWLYIAGIKYILGLNISNGYIEIKPHIPTNWNEYKIKYKLCGNIYNIKVINDNKKGTNCEQTVDKLICDGKEIEEKKIKIENNTGIYNIEVYI